MLNKLCLLNNKYAIQHEIYKSLAGVKYGDMLALIRL